MARSSESIQGHGIADLRLDLDDTIRDVVPPAALAERRRIAADRDGNGMEAAAQGDVGDPALKRTQLALGRAGSLGEQDEGAPFAEPLDAGVHEVIAVRVGQ